MSIFTNRNGYHSITQHSQILDHIISENDNSSNNDKTAITDIIYEIYGYRSHIVRQIIFHLFSIILFGLPYILLNWFPALTAFKYTKCDLNQCDIILVTNNSNLCGVINVSTVKTPKNFSSQNDTDDQDDDGNRLNINDDTAKELYLNETRLFVFEQIRYIWDTNNLRFIRLEQPYVNQKINEFLDEKYGIGIDERNILLEQYGQNVIKIEIKSYWQLLRAEIINPFYLFQIFSITLWCLDEYYYYSACVLILSGLSIITSLYETRKQSIQLHTIVEESKPEFVEIMNNAGEICEINPNNLVPGDIVVIPMTGDKFVIPCDLVLLNGICILNECILTGESAPVTKTSLNRSYEDFKENKLKNHILYGGTALIQTRQIDCDKILAKVLKTGFETSKGELIKSILYPKPIGFKFYKESIKFIVALFCIATLGMAYCVRLYVSRQEDLRTILIRTLDVITIVIPPALPMAMTAGTIYSQSRLKKLGIFCISPPQINVCGKMKLACFDKTGTLTDDGLTLYGIIEMKEHEFVNECKNPKELNIFSDMVQAMATCHSLTIFNGHYIGDPLDLEMFQSIDWTLSESLETRNKFNSIGSLIAQPMYEHSRYSIDYDAIPYGIGIIHQNQFLSEYQCMSVVVRVFGHNNLKLFIKGSPEKIYQLCNITTLPQNYFQILNEHTQMGHRVLAVGVRELSRKIKSSTVKNMSRDELERKIQFLGFIILINEMKPETKPIIKDLKMANIRTVMVTGDNLLTAISIGRKSSMISHTDDIYLIRIDDNCNDIVREERPKLIIELLHQHENTASVSCQLSRSSISSVSSIDDESQSFIINLASSLSSSEQKYHFAMDNITWDSLRTFYPELLPKILINGTIYARFRPEQKMQLIIALQQLDYIVTMCGDGANDCSALKAANIGISLSNAEASVAAPFTSKIQNISCVKYLALEGRCALVTSIGIFKFMILYSLIQFCSILILYSKYSTLGNFQFLYIDLFITASLAFTMGLQGPTENLIVKRPMSSLISLLNVIPLLLQTILCAIIQIASLVFLLSQPWYHASNFDDNSGMLIGRNAIRNSIGNRNFTRNSASFYQENIRSWENTVVFLISCFQYLILGAIYSKGRPYRKPLYTNILLIIAFVSLSGFTTLLLVRPPDILAQYFEIRPYLQDNMNENNFRLWLILFPITHLVLSFLIECLIAERGWLKTSIHIVTRKVKPRNKYKLIEKEIKENPNWLQFSAQNMIQ